MIEKAALPLKMGAPMYDARRNIEHSHVVVPRGVRGRIMYRYFNRTTHPSKGSVTLRQSLDRKRLITVPSALHKTAVACLNRWSHNNSNLGTQSEPSYLIVLPTMQQDNTQFLDSDKRLVI